MFLKVLYWLGVAACIVLIISCFLPWVYYADLKQSFNAFYSFHNEYGKPGKLLVPVAGVLLLFMLLPRVWAKRVNLFLSALAVAYAIKTYILFTSCYNNYCPEKLNGIYMMLFSSVVILIAAAFPDMRMNAQRKK